MPTTYPKSPYLKTRGIYYFARMLDKIRLHKEGRLGEDYQGNLGLFFDAHCCKFLETPYERFVELVHAGHSDEEILGICFDAHGEPDEERITVWNAFMRKSGWNDGMSAKVRMRLRDAGMTERTDIQAMFDFIDAEEGRPLQHFDV